MEWISYGIGSLCLLAAYKLGGWIREAQLRPQHRAELELERRIAERFRQSCPACREQ